MRWLRNVVYICISDVLPIHPARQRLHSLSVHRAVSRRRQVRRDLLRLQSTRFTAN